MNWRGVYEGGGLIVTTRHWWSLRDRRAARLAAKVFEYEARQAQAHGLLMTPQVRLRVSRKANALSHWPDPLYFGPSYPDRWTAKDTWGR